MPTIGFLTSDLMFHSRVSQSISDLREAGAEATLVVNRNIETLIQKIAESTDGRLVIIDLALRELDVQGVVNVIREKLPSVSIIAYGPHVAGALLQSAADAGIDAVYTRGQFDHRMTEIIQEYSLNDASTDRCNPPET